MSKDCESHNCEDCEHDCSSCEKSGNCSHEKPEKLSPNENSNIKHVYGVVSGKGGVGKSLVCSLLANKLSAQGLKVGILDADVTGPSIPKVYGTSTEITATEEAMNPVESKNNIKIISANLLLDEPDSPVAWRGPVVSGAISQFFNMVNWGDLDVLLVDMPPGTSDVFLTVMQLLPIDGIVCVTSPQELVEMIVGKAINLAKMMEVKVVSLVENMSYFECPDCGKKHEIYGKSSVEAAANKYDIKVVDKIPVDSKFAQLSDAGKIYEYDAKDLLENTAKYITKNNAK